MGTLKRNQQREKKKNAELLEVARKSEKNMTEDATQLQVVVEIKIATAGINYYKIHIYFQTKARRNSTDIQLAYLSSSYKDCIMSCVPLFSIWIMCSNPRFVPLMVCQLMISTSTTEPLQTFL